MEKWESYYRKGGKGVSRWKEPDEFLVKNILLLKKKNVHRVLDLGCGLGRNMIFLANRGFLVAGSDISKMALSKLEKKTKNLDCVLIQHDMTNLPFPDGHFDVVISIDVIHHNKSKNIKKTLNEMKRVLKKRGLVLISVPSKKHWAYEKGTKLETDTYVRPKGVHQAGIVHHFFDEKSLRKTFSMFRILKAEEMERPWKKSSVRWYVLAEKR